MSIASTIRNARTLNLAGAQPGAAAVVNRVAKTLEEEHALRMNLQREASAARHIIVQMEEEVRELRRDVVLYEDTPFVGTAMKQRADSLHRYAEALRKALSPAASE